MYWSLFALFFKIGLFTFGGGYAMIPMIKQEIVTRGYLTMEQIVEFVGISESTPGPFAVNIATFIGMEQGGILSAFFSTLGVVLPSFIIILLVAKCFAKFSENRYVKWCLSGVRPTVIGLIASATWSVGLTNFVTKQGVSILHIVIFALVFIVSLIWKKIHPICLILLSAALGILLFGDSDILAWIGLL